MSKPLVIVSAVGGDIGMAVAQELHRAGHTVVGTDTQAVDAPRNVLKSCHIVPPAADAHGYIEAIRRLVQDHEAAFFVPVSEPEIKCVDANRSAFDSLLLHLVINNPTIVNTFSDKFATAQYLVKIDLPVPGTVLLDQYQGQFGFPFIAKARFGCGSKRVWIVEDEVDWRYLVEKHGDTYVAQEYIGSADEEYTTGVFSDGNRMVSISFKRRLGMGGLTVYAELVDEPFLTDMAEKIAGCTQLVGSINIQSRRDGHCFVPFEINPRFSSTLPMRHRFGFNDAVWWLRVLKGERYHYRPRFKRGKAVRRLVQYYFEME